MDQLKQKALSAALDELRDDCADREFRRFMDVDRTGQLRLRGNEQFAVFGDTAYKLREGRLSDEWAEFEYVPAIVDGHLIGQWPDEGRSGVLHLMRCLWRKNRDGSMRPNYPSAWAGVYLHGGWIHTAELEQSDAQIARNIVEEIADGQTPLIAKRRDAEALLRSLGEDA